MPPPRRTRVPIYEPAVSYAPVPSRRTPPMDEPAVSQPPGAAGWRERLGVPEDGYLASGLVVTPFESGSAVDSALLSAHQQGQMVLSVLWAVVGVGTLAAGLRRDLHALRVAALALLGVTAAKVFLFDLATLTSLYRVASLIGLGLVLLAGACTWQRLRPRGGAPAT